ncbi:MAG: alpha/beta hydrolase, partial [Alistipes sp.]|nr:alpha/beta hydrolase [Alistipes sp.]
TPRPLYPQGAPDWNGLDTSKVQRTPEAILYAVEADYLLFPSPAGQTPSPIVVICPGGGYATTVFVHEGIKVAQWLNRQGLSAVVLRYRMPNGHPEIPLEDALHMIALARDSATQWGINPHKVGIMGFSAGGHLAAAASTLFGDTRHRPDFSILIYPVISMEPGIVDEESRDNLLGASQSDTLLTRYSCEKQVSASTPPAFLALSDDDDDVHPANSTAYYLALKRLGIPAELHIYPTGKHGWGWNGTVPHHSLFEQALSMWLQALP